jgi:hypothetical protein
MKLAFLGLLLTLTGCGGNVFSVDPAFSAEEFAVIREAAENWQIATGERIDLYYGSGGPHIARVTLDEAHKSTNLRMLEGLYLPGHPDRILLVYDIMGDVHTHRDLWLVVAMHEFGHHFGLVHDPDYRAVMFADPSAPYPQCITILDAAAYTRVTKQTAHGCPL